MDVQAEFQDLNRRLDRRAGDMAKEARSRLRRDFPDDATYVQQRRKEATRASVAQMELLGARFRELNDAMAAAVEAFARGWENAGRR